LFGYCPYLFCSCKRHNSNNETENENSDQVEVLNGRERIKNELFKNWSDLSIDSLWGLLTIRHGGCLTGGQYIRDGRFGSNGCVMARSFQWEIFFEQDTSQLVNYLLSKLSDTTTTKIHTCPFFEATTGEVAVYALQNIYKSNWFDFEEFKEYKDQKTKSVSDNHQSWLQEILTNKGDCERLIQCWERLANQ
jgi:hypothetical protein